MKEGMDSPTTWKRLYAAAAHAATAQCWRWMPDDRLIGIRHPETGEQGWLSWMGMLGEFKGLALYRGQEGLDGFRALSNKDPEREVDDWVFVQNAILLTFPEDPAGLPEEDKRAFQIWGGQGPLAVFRAYAPGWFPRSLQADEALFFAVALEQALLVSLRMLENADLTAIYPKKVVQRFWEGDQWTEETRPLPAPVITPKIRIQFSQEQIVAAKREFPKGKSLWWIDLFYAPYPEELADPPFFPLAMPVMDLQNQQVLGAPMFRPGEAPTQIFDALLAMMRAQGSMPVVVVVGRNENLLIFREVFRALGISITLDRETDFRREFRAELFQ